MEVIETGDVMNPECPVWVQFRPAGCCRHVMLSSLPPFTRMSNSVSISSHLPLRCCVTVVRPLQSQPPQSSVFQNKSSPCSSTSSSQERAGGARGCDIISPSWSSDCRLCAINSSVCNVAACLSLLLRVCRCCCVSVAAVCSTHFQSGQEPGGLWVVSPLCLLLCSSPLIGGEVTLWVGHTHVHTHTHAGLSGN